ncbi:hypothetical protein BpHYR1_033419 [Brachionus plicatilis]|uniref:Uncharacterized protein n=1 Tax=Brachionus plicatilis TaxID=10195 RepID=A0A3M7R8G0_BRAPC|nr:hypothetical protein BpHYR1_033419 [Brachionus plicatilis]
MSKQAFNHQVHKAIQNEKLKTRSMKKTCCLNIKINIKIIADLSFPTQTSKCNFIYSRLTAEQGYKY